MRFQRGCRSLLPARRYCRILIVACLVATSGCAVRQSSLVDYPASPGGQLQPPPADKALVVFLRPSFFGHAVSAAVYEDDRFVTIVMAHTHIGHFTQPGTHRYMVVSEAADFLDADLEAGKIYFVMVVPRMGAWRARFSLAAITPHSEDWNKLKAWLAESYQVTPNQSGEAWHRNNYDSVQEKKAAYLPQWLLKEARPVLLKGDGVKSF